MLCVDINWLVIKCDVLTTTKQSTRTTRLDLRAKLLQDLYPISYGCDLDYD